MDKQLFNLSVHITKVWLENMITLIPLFMQVSFTKKEKKNELKPKMGRRRDQVSYITFSILHLTLLCKQQKKCLIMLTFRFLHKMM